MTTFDLKLHTWHTKWPPVKDFLFPCRLGLPCGLWPFHFQAGLITRRSYPVFFDETKLAGLVLAWEDFSWPLSPGQLSFS